MRTFLGAFARYINSRPLLVAFTVVGLADTLGKAAAAALGTA